MLKGNILPSHWFSELTTAVIRRRAAITTVILGVALIGFEMFNYSTTVYALDDLLGVLKAFGIPWATILAIAFCGIDFAGIARLFTADTVEDTGQKGNWFLFGAWFLAATMNAILTWWGITLTFVNRSIQSTALIPADFLVNSVPVFIAILVWVTRILLIGTFSLMGNKATQHQSSYSSIRSGAGQRPASPTYPRSLPVASSRQDEEYPPEPIFGNIPQPTYHSLSARGPSSEKTTQSRRF